MTQRLNSAPESAPKLRFSVLGAGRVASSMAHWLAAMGGRPRAVVGRPESPSALRLAKALSCSVESLEQLSTAGDDLLLVAVSDPALDEVTAHLARLPQARVVLHTSGSRGAGALAGLRPRGSQVGTLHPLKAFPRPLPDLAEARGTVFGIDGDPAALELARSLAAAWDAVVVEVEEAARPVYHLAASLAAGGVVTLLALATDLASRAGVDRGVSQGYLELARGAVGQATASADLAAAITGPVARGDEATERWELEEVRNVAPELLPLILRLARETVRQVSAGKAPAGGLATLEEALQGLEEEVLQGDP